MPFGITASVVGAGGSLLGGAMSGKAAKKAAQIQADAARAIADKAGLAANTAAGYVSDATSQAQQWLGGARDTATGTVNAATGSANDILAGIFGLQTANLSPYLTAGAQGVTSLADALKPGGSLTSQFSFAPQDLENDPGYKFRLEQGTQAIENSNAARGLLSSGATLKDLTDYSQGLAGTEYQNAYNRALTSFQTNRQNNLQSIMSLAGFGLPATSQFNTAASNFGNQASANTLQSGYYGGNTALNTTELMGQWGIGAGQYAGNAALQASQIGAEALAGGANARAAGVVGGTNALTSGISGAISAFQPYLYRNYFNPYGSGIPNYMLNPGGIGTAYDAAAYAGAPGSTLVPFGGTGRY